MLLSHLHFLVVERRLTLIYLLIYLYVLLLQFFPLLFYVILHLLLVFNGLVQLLLLHHLLIKNSLVAFLVVLLNVLVRALVSQVILFKLLHHPFFVFFVDLVFDQYRFVIDFLDLEAPLFCFVE